MKSTQSLFSNAVRMMREEGRRRREEESRYVAGTIAFLSEFGGVAWRTESGKHRADTGHTETGTPTVIAGPSDRGSSGWL